MEVGLFVRSPYAMNSQEGSLPQVPHHVRLDPCRLGNDYDGNLSLRIVSAGVILIASFIGVCLPLLSSRVKWLKLSQPVYYFIKFFGTGIIVSTAWVHLLLPSFLELGSSQCLVGIFKAYNFSPIFGMVGFFAIFVLHILSLRYMDMKYLKTISHDQSKNMQNQVMNNIQDQSGDDTQRGPSTNNAHIDLSGNNEDPSMIQMSSGNTSLGVEKQNLSDKGVTNDIEKELLDKYLAKKNVITFFILEFGIIFHSVIIGLTLAVSSNKEFVSLFIAVVFHQLFEGLGLGARLFDIVNYNSTFCNWFLAFLYGIVTPFSIVIGLLFKSSYHPRASTTVIVSGILDAFSGGILMFSGFIELLAEDYIINSGIRNGNFMVLLYTLACFLMGYIAMSVIGIWV